MEPSTGEVLTQWTWEPTILLGLALLTGLYLYAVGPLRRRRRWGPPISRGRAVAFAASVLVLVFGLLSPLDYIGDRYLFSAHMVQHLLLASVWPPLMLLAIPPWLAQRAFRSRVLDSAREFLTIPILAITLFNADIYLWHLPVLYDATLTNSYVHILEHVSFMAFGFINWWPLLSPIPEQRLSYPFQVLYLFIDGMLMMVLGILFTFAPAAFYAPYATAPRLWGFSPTEDQQLGGLIMWYPGNLPYVVAICIAFYRWFDGQESPAPQGI